MLEQEEKEEGFGDGNKGSNDTNGNFVGLYMRLFLERLLVCLLVNLLFGIPYLFFIVKCECGSHRRVASA